jgi:hypothetical protein
MSHFQYGYTKDAADAVPLVVHLDIATQVSNDKGLRPLCGQVAMHNDGFSKGHYTKEAVKVSCKRCLRSLASQAK